MAWMSIQVMTKLTRKRFSEKPIVAFTNNTVLNFIIEFYMYD